ncbi:MAG: hypothetical protein WCJ60_04295 [bacterium]
MTKIPELDWSKLEPEKQINVKYYGVNHNKVIATIESLELAKQNKKDIKDWAKRKKQSSIKKRIKAHKNKKVKLDPKTAYEQHLQREHLLNINKETV